MTITGGRNCPTGTLTFSARVANDDTGKVTEIDWGIPEGDTLTLLTEKEIDNSIKEQLSELTTQP